MSIGPFSSRNHIQKCCFKNSQSTGPFALSLTSEGSTASPPPEGTASAFYLVILHTWEQLYDEQRTVDCAELAKLSTSLEIYTQADQHFHVKGLWPPTINNSGREDMQCCTRNLKLGTQYLRPVDLGTLLRKAFSSTTSTKSEPKGRLAKKEKDQDHAPLISERWSTDEDNKLLALSKQGFTAARIAKQLEDRSVVAIRRRRDYLTPSVHSIKHRPGLASSREPWTTEEDELITRMRADGLKHTEIIRSLPGRTLDALQQRWRLYLRPSVSKQPPPTTRQASKLTEEEIHRLVDLRATQHKGFQQIALEMDRHIIIVRQAWREHSRRLVPEDILRALRRHGDWTREEDATLLKLHKARMSQANIAKHIPSKSVASVRNRIEALQDQLQIDLRKPRPSRMEMMQYRRALQPVLDGRTSLDAVCAMFPSVPVKLLMHVLRRMRLGLYKTSITAADEKVDEAGG